MDDQWVIAEPGVIALPTTGYEICREAGQYWIYHNDKRLSAWLLLDNAKHAVKEHMRDLLAVGLEP